MTGRPPAITLSVPKRLARVSAPSAPIRTPAGSGMSRTPVSIGEHSCANCRNRVRPSNVPKRAKEVAPTAITPAEKRTRRKKAKSAGGRGGVRLPEGERCREQDRTREGSEHQAVGPPSFGGLDQPGHQHRQRSGRDGTNPAASNGGRTGSRLLGRSTAPTSSATRTTGTSRRNTKPCQKRSRQGTDPIQGDQRPRLRRGNGASGPL